EHGAGALEPDLVLLVSQADAGHQPLEAERVLPAELCVLEVDVVDDLGDGPESRVLEAEAREQHLERAAISFMRELGLEHVEAELARLVPVVFRRDELEPSVAIDEPADEPTARHAVDVNALAGDPGPPAILFPLRRRLGNSGLSGESGLQRRHQAL